MEFYAKEISFLNWLFLIVLVVLGWISSQPQFPKERLMLTMGTAIVTIACMSIMPGSFTPTLIGYLWVYGWATHFGKWWLHWYDVQWQHGAILVVMSAAVFISVNLLPKQPIVIDRLAQGMGMFTLIFGVVILLHTPIKRGVNWLRKVSNEE